MAELVEMIEKSADFGYIRWHVTRIDFSVEAVISGEEQDDYQYIWYIDGKLLCMSEVLYYAGY